MRKEGNGRRGETRREKVNVVKGGSEDGEEEQVEQVAVQVHTAGSASVMRAQ